MLELFLNPPGFLIYALLGGIILSLIAAPLGVFMVWQKQSYFGATLAHSALLGISFGLLMELNLTLAVILSSFLIAISIHLMEEKSRLSADTLLGILAHSTLALGLVLLSIQDNIQIDVMSYLFGDLLSITPFDLGFVLLLGVLILFFFQHHWSDMLNLTLNPALAQIEGINVKRVQLYYTLLLALMIAIAMKMVGVLLITSLLIIPAASARKFASTPEQMLGFSALFGFLSVLIGLAASFQFDLPTGPSIVLIATIIFLSSLLKKRRVI